MRSNKGYILGVVLFLFVGLNLGTIRKQDDPILNTQTNPILYKEKMEEIKDGEKGAPSPSFTHYTKQDFLSESPVEPVIPEEAKSFVTALPSPEDEIPEQVSNISEGAGEEKLDESESQVQNKDEDELVDDSWFKDDGMAADDMKQYNPPQ